MIKVNAPEPIQGQHLLTVTKSGRIDNWGLLTRFARMQHVVRRSSNSRTDRRSSEHPLSAHSTPTSDHPLAHRVPATPGLGYRLNAQAARLTKRSS